MLKIAFMGAGSTVFARNVLGDVMCTESSEHNAEYNPFYIKPAYPELIDQFNIPPGRISPPLHQPDQRMEGNEREAADRP